MRTLVDFINHGTLPFTGREEEIGALVEFWGETVEAHGLRLALLQGEAGIGKSRLIEELIPRIVRGGGVVVHTKFYPESTASIVPLLARATWLSRGGRKLLNSEPDATLAAVVTALQRIARLRPTLVVIEDLHLLGEEQPDEKAVPIRELAALLTSLAGETISFLCAARPLPAGLRGLIEPYLTREIPLRGLGEEQYRAIWSGIFGGIPGEDALLRLHEATLGNPLAIRSALRGAINAGTIARDTTDQGWKVNVSAEAFVRKLEQSVGVLSEGMAVHLTAAERAAACSIASLGEVIARESAMLILDGAERVLDGLIFKGILVPSESAPSPLGEPPSAFPLLTFTHTLVHRHFVAQTSVGAAQLLKIIASPASPLYSLLPFQRLLTLPSSTSVSLEILRSAVHRCINVVAYAINRTSDWKHAVDVWNAGCRLIDIYHDKWTADDRFLLEAQRICSRLGLLWRTPLDPEYLELVDRLLGHTAAIIEGEGLRYRLMALLYHHRITWRNDAEQAERIHQEIEELVAVAPELRSTFTYWDHLRDIAHTAWATGDLRMLRRVETQFDALFHNEEIGEQFREYGRRGIERYLFTLFDTPEELTRRRELLTRLDAADLAADPIVIVQRLLFHESTGEVDAMMEIAHAALPRFQEHGLQIEIVYTRIAQIVGGILLGENIADALAAAVALHRNAPEPIATKVRGSIGTRVLTAAVLRGEDDCVREIIRNHVDDPAALPVAIRALLGMADEAERKTLDASGPLFRLEDILRHSALLLDGGTASRLQPILVWLEERRLPVILAAMLRRHGALLGAKELTRWRKRADELQRQRRSEQAVSGKERICVSMLGVIEVRRPGAEPARLRGARLRTVLGVMVAEKLLPEPLAFREFCRIAAGEDDLESARKILNVTIFRLRETMGAEAIVTGGETPQLQTDLLDIDLVDAWTRVRAATEAARGGSLVRALPMLREAIAIMGGEVPFPGLYDSFFEALREDLEHELRAAIIEIANGLMREGDAASAEELLRYGTAAMPGDIELLELLRTTLVSLGRRADAERIRVADMP